MRYLAFFFLLAWSSLLAAQDSSSTEPCTFYYDVQSSRNIYTQTDLMPQYKGKQNFSINLSMSFKPEDNIQAGQIDTVGQASFIVETDGTLSSIKITNPTHPRIDEDVVKSLKAMSLWTCGSCSGRAVPVLIVFPYQFSLRKTKK